MTSPSVRYGMHLLLNPLSNDLALVGGMVLVEGASGALGEIWEYDPAVPAWRECPLADTRLVIAGSSVVAYPRGDTLLWLAPSGPAGEEELSILELDQSGSEWSWVVSAWSNTPSWRFDSSLVFADGLEQALMFGGVFGGNEVWAYDPGTSTWERLAPAGPQPAARSQASAVYASRDGLVYVFGGLADTGVLGDLWSYQPATGIWTEIRPSGPIPSSRVGACMVYDSSNETLVLFGGTGSGSRPPAGGGQYEGVMGDTWIYDIERNVWTELAAPGPSPRAYAAMAYEPESESFVLFGGHGSDSPLGDTWQLPL